MNYDLGDKTGGGYGSLRSPYLDVDRSVVSKKRQAEVLIPYENYGKLSFFERSCNTVGLATIGGFMTAGSCAGLVHVANRGFKNIRRPEVISVVSRVGSEVGSVGGAYALLYLGGTYILDKVRGQDILNPLGAGTLTGVLFGRRGGRLGVALGCVLGATAGVSSHLYFTDKWDLARDPWLNWIKSLWGKPTY